MSSCGPCGWALPLACSNSTWNSKIWWSVWEVPQGTKIPWDKRCQRAWECIKKEVEGPGGTEGSSEGKEIRIGSSFCFIMESTKIFNHHVFFFYGPIYSIPSHTPPFLQLHHSGVLTTPSVTFHWSCFALQYLPQGSSEAISQSCTTHIISHAPLCPSGMFHMNNRNHLHLPAHPAQVRLIHMSHMNSCKLSA